MGTTYEEAIRCPRCDQVGEHVLEEDRVIKHGPTRGSRILKAYCRNSRCRWFNTAWTIQQRPDGTIPEALLHRQKSFPQLPSWGSSAVEALEHQLALEVQPGGGELNNPNG